MIIESRKDGNEIVMRHITFKDILCIIHVAFHKDKELCFSNPVPSEEYYKDQTEGGEL